MFLKAGAVAVQPRAVADERGDVRLNVDKGNQALGGPAASVVSGIANGPPYDSGDTPFVSLERLHVHDTPVTAGEGGELWLLVGTDSGFEGVTKLYYQRIDAVLRPLPASS